MHAFTQDPTDPAFVQDPYPLYAQMRAAGDFVHWQDYDMVMATTHRAANAVLRAKTMGRAPITPRDWSNGLTHFGAVEAHSLLELEPPAHTRLRSEVLRAFTSRKIAGLSPWITQLAQELIAAFPRGESFDLIDAFGAPLPVAVIAHLLGVDPAHAPELLAWSHAMVAVYQAGKTPEDIARADAAARDFAQFIRDHLRAKAAHRQDDLLSQLVAKQADGAALSDDEIISTAILLLNAGHEATVHSIGNGAKLLLEREGIAQGEAAVEEILRFDPPLHLFTRQVYAEQDLFGTRLRRGQEVGVLLASAGRDGAVFDAPDHFRPDRANASLHLAFGAGIHFCIGAPLARLEMRAAFAALARACPDLRLCQDAEPRFADIYHFHGLTRLMVRC